MWPRHAMSRCTRQRPEHAAGCRQGLSRLVPGPATAGHHEDTVGVVDKQLFAVCKPIAARNNHLVHLRALRSVNNETLMDHANHSPPVLLASLRYGTHAACLSPSVHALMATLRNELADLPGRINVRLGIVADPCSAAGHHRHATRKRGVGGAERVGAHLWCGAARAAKDTDAHRNPRCCEPSLSPKHREFSRWLYLLLRTISRERATRIVGWSWSWMQLCRT